MARRLYVYGVGDSMIYCTASSREEAQAQLGVDVRCPDPDDVRNFWRLARVSELTGQEIREQFGVSRQTICNWWHKAGGGDLPRRADHLEKERTDKLRKVLLTMQDKSATGVARKTNVTVSRVRKLAQDMGISLDKWQRRPSDAQLIEMAKGRTWMEFADAVGLRLSTLRTYVYARPELAKAIREVRAPARTGVYAHGKLDKEKVLQLRKEGHSAYMIAQILRVEQMSVRHLLRRLAQEEEDDSSRHKRKAASSVARSR